MESYTGLTDVVRRRASVRTFDPGHGVTHETLLQNPSGRSEP